MSCSVHTLWRIFFVVRVGELAQVAQRSGRCPMPGNIQRSGWMGLWAAWSSWGCPCSLQAGCGLSACETICYYKDEKFYLRHTNLKHSFHFTEDKETVRIENVLQWCKNMKKKHFAWIGRIKAFLLKKNICMKACVKLCSIMSKILQSTAETEMSEKATSTHFLYRAFTASISQNSHVF